MPNGDRRIVPDDVTVFDDSKQIIRFFTGAPSRARAHAERFIERVSLRNGPSQKYGKRNGAAKNVGRCYRPRPTVPAASADESRLDNFAPRDAAPRRIRSEHRGDAFEKIGIVPAIVIGKRHNVAFYTG